MTKLVSRFTLTYPGIFLSALSLSRKLVHLVRQQRPVHSLPPCTVTRSWVI